MISENLTKLRKRSGLSQETVAEKLGVSRQTIAKWESGESAPDVFHSDALAKLYNVSLDNLVNYKWGSDNAPEIPPRGKYIFGAVTVGDKGQIVIPAQARNVFNIKPGDKLMVLGDIEQGLALVGTDFIMECLEKMKMNRET